MNEFFEELKSHSNKIFWILAVILLSAWFTNEYMTTKKLIREQSSALYSNVIGQYKNLLTTNKLESKEELKEIDRFKSELNRLENEYKDTVYSDFARLIKASFNLTKNDSSKVTELEPLLKKNDFSSLSEVPLKRVKEELAELLLARSLIASNEIERVKEGQDKLKDLISHAELVPVEASLSYVLSLPQEGVDQFTKFKEIKERIKQNPEIEPILQLEFSKFGIFVPEI